MPSAQALARPKTPFSSGDCRLLGPLTNCASPCLSSSSSILKYRPPPGLPRPASGVATGTFITYTERLLRFASRCLRAVRVENREPVPRLAVANDADKPGLSYPGLDRHIDPPNPPRAVPPRSASSTRAIGLHTARRPRIPARLSRNHVVPSKDRRSFSGLSILQGRRRANCRIQSCLTWYTTADHGRPTLDHISLSPACPGILGQGEVGEGRRKGENQSAT